VPRKLELERADALSAGAAPERRTRDAGEDEDDNRGKKQYAAHAETVKTRTPRRQHVSPDGWSHPTRPSERRRCPTSDTGVGGRAGASMTAWSSRADGQNTARELRRFGATRHFPHRPETPRA
jgi:hypothetical protein